MSKSSGDIPSSPNNSASNIIPEFAGGADRLPSTTYLGQRKTLIHFTDEKGLKGILYSQQLFPSTGPKHARFGDGQYFTDLLPEQISGRTLRDLTPAQRQAGQISAGQAAQRLFNDPRLSRKLTHFVEIDISDLPIRQGLNAEGTAIRDGVQVFINQGNLDLSERIVRHGRTF